MPNSRTIITATLALYLAQAAGAPSAMSKDLNVLTRVLYAAFFVQQGAAMCSVPSITLSSWDKATLLSAFPYANQMKLKVSEGLSQEEQILVLKAAADRARDELKQVVEVLKSFPPDRENAALAEWCTTKMTGFVTKIVNGYAFEREQIDNLIKRSKAD